MPAIPTADTQQVGSKLLTLLACVDLTQAELDPEDVHRIRVAIKQTRAWLKLCRGLTGKTTNYQQLVANLRSLSASLARQRDRDVALQTLTKLARKYPGKKMQQLVEALQPALASLPPVAQEAAARQVIIDRIQKDLALFTQLTIPPSTQADVVNHTYAKMCKLGNAALVSEACTELHAWRKLVKTLGYQLAMLDMKTPDKARLLSRMIRLGSKLGDVHDLCFLQEMIEGSALLLCQELDMGPLFKRIARERAALLKTIRKRYCHVCPPPRQQAS